MNFAGSVYGRWRIVVLAILATTSLAGH